MAGHLRKLCAATDHKNSQTNLDQCCISLVVQNLDPGNRAKLLKGIKERIRVGQVGRDVGHQEHNLSHENAISTHMMYEMGYLAPAALPQLPPLLQGVLRSLEGVALTHLCLHQEPPMNPLPHLAGSWSSPVSQVDHSSPSVRSLAAAGSAVLSVAAEQSSAAAESAAAAC